MIGMSEALRWLNRFDSSHMNGTNQQLLATARSPRTDKAAVQDLVRTALQQARSSPQDNLDYLETLLNCGVIEFDRGFLESARDHLAAANTSYNRANDLHGAAVAAWMLGIAWLALQETNLTHENWTWSTEVFVGFRTASRHVQKTRKWYTAVIIKMYQDLITLPQESFSWLKLKLLGGSRLSATSRDLVQLLGQNIGTGNWNEADRLIRTLKEREKTLSDPLERAEIFANTGLARFRMRENSLSIDDLKAAVRAYPMSGHHQECARWLLGAVQFGSEDHREEALKNWGKGVEGFAKLSETADQNNRLADRRWYRDRIAFMNAAIQGKVKEYFS